LITLGILLGLMVAFPALGTAVVGFLGALLVAVAASPTAWAFAAGLALGPRILRIARSLT
jgi:hypothetical protein